MKVSRTWLQTYFAEPLPKDDELRDALTFHVFEVEEIDGDLIDLKVLADRAAYGMSHRGVALEISAALDRSLLHDPLRESIPEYPTTSEFFVTIHDPERCSRYHGALVKGVTVGPSPEWLKSALESVGQRSINNVVDATNYVMLNIGQPLHAFDAGKVSVGDGTRGIEIRTTEEGETITTLTGEEYALPVDTLVIADAFTRAPLGIAGVKGGIVAQIDATTTDLLIESATFDGPSVRRTASSLKLFTDASQRFQHSLSPELSGYGLREVLTLIQKVAGGTLVGVSTAGTDVPDGRLAPVTVSLGKIRSVLGMSLEADEVASALGRLGLTFIEEGGIFIVTPSFERRDLLIPEDIVEEVGRTIGYDNVPSTPLPMQSVPVDQARFKGIERIKDFLVERGFTELSTQSFAQNGDIKLANPLQSDRPFLRASLLQNMESALAHAVTVAARTLGPADFIKLFEIGSVFATGGETLVLSLGIRALVGNQERASDALKEYLATLQQELFGEPLHVQYAIDGLKAELTVSAIDVAGLAEETIVATTLGVYQPYSVYPSALRDIAVWTPEGTTAEEVEVVIHESAGTLLLRLDQFDSFTKDGRVSYAFRLVFESMERTLSDEDLDPAMARVSAVLNALPGFEVR